ncbi:hypothetical protein [Ramlibacter sp. AN1133]|uniref:hypothetical protein n=1 Tax=Ramlibacter sp. AN1133 TaxID=3133429 RepID=UPI0030BB558C
MTAEPSFSAGVIAPLLSCVLFAACASQTPAAGPNACHSRDALQQCPLMPTRVLAELNEGTATAMIDARCHWNSTGVLLEPDAHYRITAAKVVEGWADSWQPESDLKDGWPGIFRLSGKLFQLRARAPGHPMYSLVGAEGRDESTFFVAGWEQTLTATRRAELLFFANDWENHYQNNHGCVEVRIQRLRRTSRSSAND